MENLTQLESHFEFGKNWQDYAKTIDQKRIDHAITSLEKLLGQNDIKGKHVLDIGCGSGLSSLAMLTLGAGKLQAIDIDPYSVNTTQQLLTHHTPDKNFTCEEVSIFDIENKQYEPFDIVYSWGVLHHTGNMYEAIRKASQLVKKDGIFILALYKKTPCCTMWKYIKRFYTSAPKWLQATLRYLYVALFSTRLLASGINPTTYCKEYETNRGMSFMHDVHDWIGGYPYESISPEELHNFATSLNMTVEKEFLIDDINGVFGSGCDEYVLRKN